MTPEREEVLGNRPPGAGSTRDADGGGTGRDDNGTHAYASFLTADVWVADKVVDAARRREVPSPAQRGICISAASLPAGSGLSSASSGRLLPRPEPARMDSAQAGSGVSAGT